MASHDELLKEVTKLRSDFDNHISQDDEAFGIMKDIDARVRKIEAKFNRYGALITGIVMGVSAVWTIAMALLHYLPHLWSSLKGGH